MIIYPQCFLYELTFIFTHRCKKYSCKQKNFNIQLFLAVNSSTLNYDRFTADDILESDEALDKDMSDSKEEVDINV